MKLQKLFKVVGAVVVGAAAILFMAFLGGTMLWILYPHIHALFPTAAENEIISETLSWWDSVCIVWIFSIFTGAGKSKSEK